jgi:rod shape determining protein RodA
MKMLFRWLSPLRRLDWIAFLTMLLLLITGVVFIYSAGIGDSGLSVLNKMWFKQLIFIGLGIPVYLAAALFDYRNFRDIAGIIYAGSIVILIAVLIFGVERNGSRSWFDLKIFYFQPAELAKIGLVITLAAYLGDPLRNTRIPSTILYALGLGAGICALILLQPDFGTAMIIPCVVLAMLFISGIPWRILGVILVIGALTLPVGWSLLKDYQKERILVFLNPDRDPLGAGWNMKQSKMAVGSGGLNGKGIGQGTQNLLGFLPTTVAPTDFVFSVVAEEKGFVGSTWLTSLYSLLFICLARTSLKNPDPFGRLISVGILAMLFMHVTINVSMTIGLMPIVGLPLPLVSYGGSFVLSMMLALGLTQSVHLRRS